MFENSIFKIEFSILLGLFPHHNLYRLTFQSFVLREYIIFHKGVDNFEIDHKTCKFLVRGAVPL